MGKKRWSEFFLYLLRIFVLLVLLAIILPKIVGVWQGWLFSLIDHDRKPSGNPLRVEEPLKESPWRIVLKLFPE